MPPLFATATHVLGRTLLRTSCEASVLILLALAIRAVMGRLLAPRWRYALWLLVVVRLALPVVPASPASIFNLTRLWSLGESGVAAWSSTGAPSRTEASIPGQAQGGGSPLSAPFESMLLVVWAVGAGLLAARVAVRSHRLAAHVRRQQVVTRPDVLALLEDCKRELNVRVPIQIVEAAPVTGAAVMGLFRPRLLLPAGLLQTFDRDALRMLFLHELVHVKRQDVLVNWLATLVHVLHWFNPLAAVAMAQLREDRELATDSLVLCHGTDDRQLYGTTLIRLLDFAAEANPLPGSVVGVLEDKAELKRRVTMIVTHRPEDYRRSAFAVALLITLALTTLTGSIAADVPVTFKGVVFVRGLPERDGSVKDGEFLEGAAVVFHNEMTGRDYVATTSDAGEFTVAASPGRYRIVVDGSPGAKATFAAATEKYTRSGLKMYPMSLGTGPGGGHALRYVHAGETWKLMLNAPTPEGTWVCNPCGNGMILDRPSGVLTVKLVDKSGAAVKTATGRVRNVATGSEYVAIVPDPWGGELSAGEFAVNGAPGMYALTIEAPGMKTLVTRTKLVEDSNEPVKLSLDPDESR